MVVKVKLEGLNIVRARGKYYVYLRDSGEALLRGFEGSREDLNKRLAAVDMIDRYNRRRKRDLTKTFPEGTLGGLIQWYENECPRFERLSEATKKDYRAAFVYLASEWDAPLDTITQPSLYDVRDTCAKEKWPRFADKMIAALSAMFTEAVKRKKITANPAMGIDKAHKADPNANREWTQAEWEAATDGAPKEILIPLMLARYVGFRGQTIQALQWSQYETDPRFGKCLRVITRKNSEPTWVPAVPELQAFLDGLDRSSLKIATQEDGAPWPDEKAMQTAVSHYLRALEKDGRIGAQTTLHGLRATYAADLRRNGAATGDVAAALGDRSERMGEHYTRHVENETRVIRAFKGKTNP